MIGKRPLVSVVDDDESVREALPDLLRQFGFSAHAFSSAEDFLASEVMLFGAHAHETRAQERPGPEIERVAKVLLFHRA